MKPSVYIMLTAFALLSLAACKSKAIYVPVETIRTEFNQNARGGKQISLADLIVLAGNAGVEHTNTCIATAC